MTEPKPSQSVLVVDDSPDSRELAARHLKDAGFEVRTAPGADAARAILQEGSVDLVLTDLRMPKVSGLELTRYVRDNCRSTAIVMFTGYPSIDGAVTAVHSGADDYLTKPFTEQELLAAVRRALQRQRQRQHVEHAAEHAQIARYGMIGTSPAMQIVFRSIKKVAASNAGALILGESGVGKELVAAAIHRESARKDAPMVPVNCGAIPPELFESELFGHARGAFTGASSDHIGFFQASDGGTLFLDEISELTLKLQVKLLRVLQDRQVYMLGSTRPRSVDVRILAATSKDLQAMVAAGTFREDLFYRISVVVIPVPPLRERGDDLHLLVRHFADGFAAEQERPPLSFSDEVMNALRSHSWPGNVRELENLMQRLSVMVEQGEVAVTDLPKQMRYALPVSEAPSSGLRQVELEHIRAVLESVGGNKTQAARILGIDRKTLREKLKS